MNSLNVISGRAHSGKTKIMIEKAKKFLGKGAKVIYLTTEDSKESISNRLGYFSHIIEIFEEPNLTVDKILEYAKIEDLMVLMVDNINNVEGFSFYMIDEISYNHNILFYCTLNLV